MRLTRGEFLAGAAAALAAALRPGGAGAEGEKAMLTRPIPKTGEAVPVIGLGTWQTFDAGPELGSRKLLRQVLDALFEGGGKVIDSSPMYGRAEGVVGDLLAAMDGQEKAFLATKVWTSGRERGEEQMRRSAQLLRKPVIDLMQVHNLLDWEVHLATLRRLKEEGKIRHLGITHYTADSLPELQRIAIREKVDFVQLGFSIGSREAERRVLPALAEKQIAVIVNQPFEEGALFRRAKGKALPEWAGEIGVASWSQYFLKYIVGHPAVTCVIPATAKVDHMRDNLGGGMGPIPDEAQRKRMAAYWEEL
jgi:diketogulonate reductase-like aldo/keto reductase